MRRSNFRKDGVPDIILDENPSINLGNLFYPQYIIDIQGRFV